MSNREFLGMDLRISFSASQLLWISVVNKSDKGELQCAPTNGYLFQPAEYIVHFIRDPLHRTQTRLIEFPFASLFHRMAYGQTKSLILFFIHLITSRLRQSTTARQAG
jgi:hypothetical protein